MALSLVPNTPDNWRQNACTLAWICQLAYFDEPECSSEFIKLGFTPMKIFSVDGTQAFVAVRGDDAVLVFRGTEGSKLRQAEGLGDVFDDGLVWRVPAPGGGTAHRGFQGALGRVWVAVRDAVASTGAQRLWITGHSLGGALAVIAAMRFAVEVRRVPDGLFTFGQPRVGDATFAAACDTHLGTVTHRIVHAEDIVARIPRIGFKHFGRLHFFDRHGSVSDRTPNLIEQGFDQLFKLGVINWAQKLRAGTPLIDDHMIWNYRERLDA